MSTTGHSPVEQKYLLAGELLANIASVPVRHLRGNFKSSSQSYNRAIMGYAENTG